MWSEGGDEDSEIRDLGDEPQWQVSGAAMSAGDAEAQHEREQPRSLNAEGIEEEIAGENAGDLDQADMYSGGGDSELVQDDEEVADIHDEVTRGTDGDVDDEEP